jgi:choline dehydrogenase-like flavoprotein
MAIINFNGVGGGTILFNAIWIRMLASNFRTRTLDGVADDWPIGYDDLLPFYERTDREVGVSGLGGNPAYPPGADPPLPPLPMTPAGLRVARAFRRRGWHWWPDTNAILSTPYDGRHACVQRGTCGTGCNEGAKSSIDVTHWRRVTELGGEVITGARVTRIVLDDHGLAAGAEWTDQSGGTHFHGGDVVLVAANGVGTPRLLLASACDRFPDGLANTSGLVGRRLMLHPIAVVSATFDDQVEGWRGHFGSSIQSLEFAETDRSRGHVRGSKWAMHPSGSPAGDAVGILAAGGGGPNFHREFASRFGHGVMWSIMCEDLPDPENRVVLSPSLTDSSGLPAPKLIYRYGENSLQALDYSIERAKEVMSDAGAAQVFGFVAGGNAHLMGTARMGDDPGESVVDRWSMSHDIPNLGILDASVFVTAGAVNPTSTICALSLRAAEHLLEARHALPVPQRRSLVAFEGRPARPAAPDPTPVLIAPPRLTPEDRDIVAAVADGLIPEGEGMPSAGPIVSERIDQILRARPDLDAPVRAVLDDPAAVGADPAGHHEFISLVAAAYFMDSTVRERIGHPGNAARSVQPDLYPAYIEEGLLEHLLDGSWPRARHLAEATVTAVETA